MINLAWPVDKKFYLMYVSLLLLSPYLLKDYLYLSADYPYVSFIGCS